jgi:uncharacterized membrane protein
MPIEAYLLEWVQLVLRWAHVITGIAWIGSSFYFIWLDARLNVPPRDPENAQVGGDLWAVHGGGFYHSQKYKVAPDTLPEPLHWFKWEAYFTWMTGFALFVVVYYFNAEALLLPPEGSGLEPQGAILASASLVAIGWLVYDGLNRLGLGDSWFAVIGAALLLALCFAVSQMFSGRGAFMQVGVMLGTIMAANVFFIIIPAQKQLVAAKLAGSAPDALLAVRARQRSVHNNYLTLPVVFAMISPHFPFTYGRPYNWLLLFVIFLGGALVRHYFNLRNRGRNVVALPAAAAVILIALVFATAPRPPAPTSTTSATPAASGGPAASGNEQQAPAAFANVRSIIDARCLACHAAKTTHPTAPVAANGVMFDTPRQIGIWAPRIFERVVVSRTMPLGNLTQMTEPERAAVERWYRAGAHVD